MEKIEERRYPTWDNDLIMCPSQCYCYFEADGKNTVYTSDGVGMTHGQLK